MPMKQVIRQVNLRIVREVLSTEQSTHNALKCSRMPAETSSHRNIKYLLQCYCLDHGLDFWTEATFRNGGRADFIVSDWKLVIEVLTTETRERFESKQYPLPVVPVSSKMDLFQVNELMDDLATCNGTNSDYYLKRYFWRD